MPLAFTSLSHGRIAFGFFHIETPLLLLENHFFWADAFCSGVAACATAPTAEAFQTDMQGYVIDPAGQVGDLMGAIHGVRYTGFIGDLYRRCPFPQDPAGFKQKPEGLLDRATVTGRIGRFGSPCRIGLAVAATGDEAGIGPFRFDRMEFHELIRYVQRGGYPRWLDERQPGFVRQMRAAVGTSAHPVFRSLELGA